MQTSNLQIPSLNATAVSAPKANLNLSAGGGDNAFKQALSREMDQRQANHGGPAAKTPERPAASRSSAPKPATTNAPAKPASAAEMENDSVL